MRPAATDRRIIFRLVVSANVFAIKPVTRTIKGDTKATVCRMVVSLSGSSEIWGSEIWSAGSGG